MKKYLLGLSGTRRLDAEPNLFPHPRRPSSHGPKSIAPRDSNKEPDQKMSLFPSMANPGLFRCVRGAGRAAACDAPS